MSRARVLAFLENTGSVVCNLFVEMDDFKQDERTELLVNLALHLSENVY